MSSLFGKVNIVIPMAGGGQAFKKAGYAFPKPLIDIGGKTMIELVTENINRKMIILSCLFAKKNIIQNMIFIMF